MRLRRRLALVAATVLLASMIEYALIATSTSTSDPVAHDGTIISQN